MEGLALSGRTDLLHIGIGGGLGGDVNEEALRDLDLPPFTPPEGGGSTRGLGVRPRRHPGANDTAGKKEDPPEGPFILSEALPVVPAKLVRRILRAEYVDMAELLKGGREDGGCWRTVGRVSHTLVAGNLGGKSQISLAGYTASVCTQQW